MNSWAQSNRKLLFGNGRANSPQISFHTAAQWVPLHSSIKEWSLSPKTGLRSKDSQSTSYPILDLHLYISTSFNDWFQTSKVALVTSLTASSPMKSGCMSVSLLTSNFVFEMFTVSSHSETTSSTVSAVHQLEVKDETSEPSTEESLHAVQV